AGDVQGEGDRGVSPGGGELDPLDGAVVGELERQGLAGDARAVTGAQVHAGEVAEIPGVDGDGACEGDVAGARVGDQQLPGAALGARGVARGGAGGRRVEAGHRRRPALAHGHRGGGGGHRHAVDGGAGGGGGVGDLPGGQVGGRGGVAAGAGLAAAAG